MKSRITEANVVSEALAILNEEPDDLSKFEISERVELRITRKQLHELLSPFKDSTEPAKQGKFDKIKDFYRRRAKRILATDMLYCYQPKLQVNDAMLALVEKLAEVFPEYDALQLLLPNVVVPEGFKTKQYNNFIVTEDGYLVDLVKAFDEARANKDHFYFHPALRRDELTGRMECIKDLNLLLHHSPEAAYYANAIFGMSRAQYSADQKAHGSNPDLPKDKVCEEARRVLLEAIDKHNCSRTHSAHGEEGKKNLMKKLMKPIKGLRDLAELLGDEECIPRNEWNEFLSYVSRNELFKLVVTTPDRLNKQAATTEVELSLNELSDSFKSKIEWPTSHTAKRALCYILVFLQNDFTKDRTNEYKKMGGGFFSSWTGQVSKTEVTNITAAFMDFLVSDDPQLQDMRDIESYLTTKNITVLSPSCQSLKNKIIDAGRLCAGVTATLSQSVALASPQ